MSADQPTEDKYSYQIRPFVKHKNGQDNVIDQKMTKIYINNHSRLIGALIKNNVNGEQINKNKIMELQDQLLKTKKEISLKQCHLAKQKNNLLNKIQLLSMQNTQIKQRQNNLSQINHTLTLALQNKNSHSQRLDKKDQETIKEMRNQIAKKDKNIQEHKKIIEQYKGKWQNVSYSLQIKMRERDDKIEQLTKRNRQLCEQYQQKINKIKLAITNLSNTTLLDTIFKGVNNEFKSNSFDRSFVTQIQYNQRFDVSQINDESFPEITYKSKASTSNQTNTKPHKKVIKINRYQSSNFRPPNTSSFLHNNNSSFIQSKAQSSYMFSQQSEDIYHQCEVQRYLCQICKQVYQQKEFRQHMNHCKEVGLLHKKKRELEEALSQIQIQERKSISKAKTPLKCYAGNKRFGDMGQPKRLDLSQIINEGWQTNNSSKQIKKKNINYSKESVEELNKIMSDLSYAQNNRDRQHQHQTINTVRYNKGSNFY